MKLENHKVTAVYTGRLGEDERDTFFVGTSTHILAYQIEDNADLFYKEVSRSIRLLILPDFRQRRVKAELTNDD
jgi:hypothetical protein